MRNLARCLPRKALVELLCYCNDERKRFRCQPEDNIDEMAKRITTQVFTHNIETEEAELATRKAKPEAYNSP